MSAAAPTGQILVGDVRTVLERLPDGSVDCIVTSPPYFRLRNYGHGQQIGLEQHVDAWVNELVLVTNGLKRVLSPTGSLWLNLGDTYAKHERDGARPKSLLLAPERLAIAMIRNGWILRNKTIWAKSNPMPTSVKDRLSCTWEVVYFFTKSDRYYFDLDAIRTPHRSTRTAPPAHRPPRGQWSVPAEWRGPSSGTNTGLDALKTSGLAGHPLGKNPGDVWTIPTAGYRGAHHAVYPTTLIDKPILATCPPRLCTTCATAWIRTTPAPHDHRKGLPILIGPVVKACDCRSDANRPGVVLDPFMGSGTTAIVAEQHGRDWLGIEVNPEFAAQARRRIANHRIARNAAADRDSTEDTDLRRHDRAA